MPTYKDINLLTQRPSITGTEKLPVSDTEYITPSQIIEPTVIKDKGFNGGSTLAIVDENSDAIVQFEGGHIKTKEFDSRSAPTMDEGGNGTHKLAIVDESGESIVQFNGGHIKTKYFDSEAVLTQIGDIETLLAAI